MSLTTSKASVFRFMRTSLTITNAPALRGVIGETGLRPAPRLMTGRTGGHPCHWVMPCAAKGLIARKVEKWKKWKSGKMEKWKNGRMEKSKETIDVSSVRRGRNCRHTKQSRFLSESQSQFGNVTMTVATCTVQDDSNEAFS